MLQVFCDLCDVEERILNLSCSQKGFRLGSALEKHSISDQTNLLDTPLKYVADSFDLENIFILSN